MRNITRILGTLATALLLAGGTAATAGPAMAAGQAVDVSIAEVSLAGPAVVPVKVTVQNNSPAKLSRLSVRLAGPVGWTLYPASQDVKKDLGAGDSVVLDYQIHVPSQPAGFTLRQFTATASYKGGDGAGTASGVRNQFSGDALPNLAAAYNNVGVTSLASIPAGNFDGERNSFSAEQLALKGVTPGSTVEALGAKFTWPAVQPGAADNAAGGGKTIRLPGQGSKLAFLGSGIGSAVGTVTVWYSDGSSSTGNFGFPNWSVENATNHNATLVIATDGRNTPAGYANANYQYRVFANSIAIDPAKTVEMVTLPSNGGVHLFDVAFVK
ncbi:NEW3 domain-containing protein [Arthrobacter sp. CJ23]|uniref:NEW3 domain-containing protein n=1 Tax=Arthrobacter sp. CJ23 TaxID=2972479 RepID=UPI00215C77C6|nr:NEW3 domain-containing protein [Arthrobacter sp. CJ23]UVJ38664.1 NEW3 domain-containing protein [Arthrobacter sp. CJ23]